MHELRDLTRLTIYNIVDNDSDSLSSPCTCVTPIKGIKKSSNIRDERPCIYTQETASLIQRDGELNMEKMCTAAHGLSLLLVAEYQDSSSPDTVDETGGGRKPVAQRECVLFDGGPDPNVWRANIHKLGLSDLLKDVETVVLSHYHADHSNGLRSAVPDIVRARSNSGIGRIEKDTSTSLVVDLHHKPITTRGLKMRGKIYPMAPPNPTVEELESYGADVRLYKKGHVTSGGCLYVSGEIPRETLFETGLKGHFSQLKDGNWVPDEQILDERYVACNIRGRGTVVISACSHAGIINVCHDAKKKLETNITAVVGGFHLAGSSVEERIEATVRGLEDLNPDVVLAGHCTGWKGKVALANAFEYTFQPLAVGGKYIFNSM